MEASSLLPTFLTLRDRCHWCWTYASHMSVGEVALTLLLMDIETPLNQAAADKILQYRADYTNRPSNAISFSLVLEHLGPPPLTVEAARGASNSMANCITRLT